MNEINLLKNYPITKRNLDEAIVERTDEVREVARRFDQNFFDGERKFGYGGYNYDPRFWTQVVKDFRDYYNLKDGSKILDIGCGKGFMVYDFLKLNPNLEILGIDISNYAIKNCKEEVRQNLKIASCDDLPFEDNTFDLVISINTIHNLDKDGCGKSLREINRVSKKNKFIIVDAYRNDEEKKKNVCMEFDSKNNYACRRVVKVF